MSENGHPGHVWLDRFLQAQAAVGFESLWIAFRLGQAGALLGAESDTDLAGMLDQIEEDVSDFERSAGNFAVVVRDMLANARAHIG